MRDIKLPLVVAVFLGVVLLGMGARTLYYQKRVVDPMATVAREVVGVRSLEVLTAKSGGKEVHVRLGPDIRLEEVYQQLERIAADTFGPSYGRLVLSDERSAHLSDTYYQIHFSIQQGISTGHFAAMADEIEEKLSEARLTAHRVFVGDRHVFVQLQEGDYYLYEVVARPSYGALSEFSGKGVVALW